MFEKTTTEYMTLSMLTVLLLM